MRLDEIEKYQHIWYHGSGMDFEHFKLDAKKANRTTNVEGIYLTQDEVLAREYASMQTNGIVYEVEHNTSRPFYENKSEVTNEMVKAYIQLLVKYTNYSEKWARTAIAPEFKETGRMKGDLDGAIKRQVYEAGGYDSYIFNDMGDTVLVVFDPADITILNKFNPQKLENDPTYDDSIKTPAKKEELPEPKKEKKPRPGDDDTLGQLLHDFDF